MDINFNEYDFQDILDLIPDAIIVVSDQGKIIFVNSQAVFLFGHPRYALLDKPAEYFISTTTENCKWYKAPSDKESLDIIQELNVKNIDGSYLPVAIKLTPLVTNTGSCVIATVRDITEQKQAEKQRLESEKFYRALFEQSPDAVFVINLEGKHIIMALSLI